jgi:signal transduction histidine kinase/CheY-like chemotaxis protein
MSPQAPKPSPQRPQKPAPQAPPPAAMGDAEAFDAAPDPMAMLAADGALIAANAAFRTAFRFTVTPSRPPWGRTTPPPFPTVDGAEGVRQFEAAAPDGRIFEWRERQLPDNTRLAIARDVTDRSAAAAAGDRAKTALFATLTHELRTPLNGVLGMAGLLARTPLDPSQQEFVTALRRSGEHLLDLITEILDFSRLEAGRIVLEDAPFDPEAVVQEVIELLSPKAHDKGLELIARLGPATPQTLRGDAGRLRQVLFNLVGNAVKFTESGGVAVSVAATAAAGPLPGGAVRLKIAVRDTGPGVPEDKQSLIFEEFAQADAAHARLHGGTGLGLAIVRKLCATMGGTVSLASKPGQGATFTVELPFIALAPPEADHPLKGVQVWLLSANPIVAAEGVALLAGLGAQARAAASLPKGANPDVILLDHAPGASPPVRLPQAAPVIVLAPQEERAIVSAYKARGAGHYVLKPLRRRSLVEQIRSVADRGPGQAPPTALWRDERDQDDSGESTLSGLRVLVADDNPINALLARTMLTRAGCQVQVVGDGEEAVAAVLKAAPPFDLVLLDLRMPGVDGFAAARLIRAAAGPAGKTPLVALTADNGEEDRKAAAAAGMDAFLTKPISVARLMQAVARFTRTPNGPTVPGGARKA